MGEREAKPQKTRIGTDSNNGGGTFLSPKKERESGMGERHKGTEAQRHRGTKGGERLKAEWELDPRRTRRVTK